MNSEFQAKNDIVIGIANIMRQNNIIHISVEDKKIEYLTETKTVVSTGKKSVKPSKKKNLKKSKPKVAKVASSTSSDDCSDCSTSSDDCSDHSTSCEDCCAKQFINDKNVKKSSEKKKTKNVKPTILRPVTAYNSYVIKRMREIPDERPSLDRREYMKIIVGEWNKMQKDKSKKKREDDGDNSSITY